MDYFYSKKLLMSITLLLLRVYEMYTGITTGRDCGGMVLEGADYSRSMK